MSAQPTAIALIPRKVLFGNPDRSYPQLSPDAAHMAYIAPFKGVQNIWLRSVGAEDDHVLTKDKGRGIIYYTWTYNSSQIIYMQDQDGDENYRLYALDAATGKVCCLTPADPKVAHNVQAKVQARSTDHPHELIIALNNRDQSCHDLYHLDLRTLERKLVLESWPLVQAWLVDHDLQVRGCTEALPDGGTVLKLRDGAGGAWRELFRWSMEDVSVSRVLGFTPDNTGLYLLDSRGRDTAGLAQYDIATGVIEWLASDPQYDISSVVLHPTRHMAQAAGVRRERMQWTVLDPQEQADFDRLQAAHHGDLQFYPRANDNMHWMVSYLRDDGPLEYYLYNRHTEELSFLFYSCEALGDAPLVRMQPVRFTARDGLTVHGYLTLPRGWQGPGPLVLNVHGGPWARDFWGYNNQAQWLANRGYACLQVNFRGSTGYGKAFVNAGNREWGRKMQHDLSDGVAWAVAQGIADPVKVVIYGGSYGGYAALAGVTFTPELYAGGVSMCGPSNMETLLKSLPAYWEKDRFENDMRIGRLPRYEDGPRDGQPKDEADWNAEDRAAIEFLRSRSPLYHMDRLRAPMLIAQGANDPRVNQAESEQFVAAMRAKNLEVEYALYPNEGHGFARPENRFDIFARAEAFLARILGGRAES
jgi:dienelactone hydrolase